MEQVYGAFDLHSTNNYLAISDHEDKRLYKKKLPGGLIAAVLAADTHEKNTSSHLNFERLSTKGEQIEIYNKFVVLYNYSKSSHSPKPLIAVCNRGLTFPGVVLCKRIVRQELNLRKDGNSFPSAPMNSSIFENLGSIDK